jgi:hypothetical protein
MNYTGTAALLVLLLFGTSITAVAQAPQPAVSWNNVTLGGAAAPLRSFIGDPLRITSFDAGARRIARYWMPGSNATYFLVIEERGYVIGFNAFADPPSAAVAGNVPADPSGVRIGDTLAAVKAKHPEFRSGVDDDGSPYLIGNASPGVAVVYTLANDRVSGFQWGTKVAADLPELPPISEPTGISAPAAVLDVQRNETDGVAWEYRYIAFLPCADGQRWQLKNQSLLTDHGHAFDRLHVVCPTSKAERDFFFDIASYFGKL